MSELEQIKDEKPKYEKPVIIDLSEPPIGEGITTCTSGPSGGAG